ncbi:MAG TPA: BON domain-containing protein [Thermoanaerobaculia bacterium]|nr:BON domain-containing protein [Thermoanaerobaculia bacterium]
MRTTTKLSAAALVALLSFSIPSMARDTSPPATDLTARFADGGFHINGLQAIEVGGIVVLRGLTTDPAEVTRVADFAHNLGYQRVANVVKLAEAADDEAIERSAERALGSHRTLDGCTFRIDSQQGVVHIAGRVQYELQKDIAADLVRNISGVRDVKMELQR